MIKKDTNSISSIYDGKMVIEKIYKGIVKVYEYLIKLLASGIPPLTLLKCKQADLADYKIFGESMQEETPNMLDKELSEIMGYYGRYIRDDGTTADGLMWYEITPYTGQIPTSLNWYVTKPLPIEPDTYYMYLGLQDANNPAYIFLEEDMSTIINGKNIKGSAIFKSPSNARYIVMSIRTDVVETMKLQELFPTPDKPVEIESVGDKTINLCPSFYPKNYPTDSEMEKHKFPIKPNTTYSVYFDIGISSYKSIWLYDNDGNVTKMITYAYAPTAYNKMAVSTKEHSYMSIGSIDSSTKVMVAEGLYYTLNDRQQTNLNNLGFTGVTSGDLPYEPYGYKIPVKARGKNFLKYKGLDNVHAVIDSSTTPIPDLDGGQLYYGNGTGNFIVINGEYSYGENYVSWTPNTKLQGPAYSIKVKPNTTYRYSHKDENGNYVRGIIITIIYYDINGARISSTNLVEDTYTKYVSFTTPENTKFIIVNLRGADAGTTYNVYDMQVEEGIEITEYEPFVEPVKTNIYLKEPLRKIGDDTDYIDFGNQKVIRNIKEKVLNGNESWAVYSSTPGMYYTSILNDNIIASSPGLCSHFVWSNPIKDEGQCYVAGKGASFHNFFLRDVNKFPTKDDLIAFLKENNVKFIAVLETPTEETVELPNVPLNKGTNIIEIDTTITPSNMEVTYLGKK